MLVKEAPGANVNTLLFDALRFSTMTTKQRHFINT